ncbi:hypothetical protein T01_14241 [Trichinella spiralis]|uniref:Uncharacterized protein n=1 Tax=Trichinella spiralis TaxID=6334 RepID=A0A0V1AZ69_TRISP|nr:hypothetical protein T01_14241 [Trichinella spiralis]
MEVVHIVFDHNGIESVSCHRCSSIVGVVDRFQLFKSFCREILNGLHPHRQGNTTSHLVMHRAFVKAGIMPYPAFSRNYMLQCRYVNAIKKYKVGDAAF